MATVRTTTNSRSRRAAALLCLAALCVCCLITSLACLSPACAFADSVELRNWSVVGSQSDELRPAAQPENMPHYAVLEFSASTSPHTRPDLLQKNLSLISLRTADGQPVEAAHVRAAQQETGEEAGVFYIDLVENLAPLTDYCIVIEPGIEAASGDTTSKRYEIPFRTDASLGSGYSVFSIAVACAAALAVVVGVASQVTRRRRGRR